ncbi:DUF5324 family protein [Streptomyces griseomycini]|uniref:Flagellar biosynthesis GTPase FlhF n=1 Tax=Streptomyces griseomycini TaxID=66895 RepID=A0A7W7PQS9_9ACTN|nr:DUF5324 family protein [Streptomyces griseomycini]MBB4897948.1 flagellar biosynthesis GTPase FlhF [Streptomyces griseomycini]GGQ09298.1 hypothetical protein GCM10010266_35850 [Streptomyces griseomycini]GGR32769.1 hypothetical protein GCM10015536_43110 [Streptomyces griseomycini]
MTRIDSVRAATGSAKESVLHAAEVVAPYADSAKVRAAHYAQEARVRLAPKVTQAAGHARVQYGTHVQPYLEQARTHVPPKVDQAAHEAALRTRRAARQAAEYSRPMIEQAMAAAGPAKEEAAARSAAALAALRGQVSAQQIQKLVRKQQRRAKAGRTARTVLILGVVAGGAFAAWKWWDKQANPDWLVEPPAATDVSESATLTSVDGSAGSTLAPEVEAKEAEEEAAKRDEQP